jgi:thiol-disulfide isomerase/thioredoxin
MKNFFLVFFLAAVSLNLYNQSQTGYDISVNISGLGDSTVYLAYHLGDKQFLKDTLKLDTNGHGILKGKEKLQQGIYMIVLPGKKYFEILMSEDQHFALYCSYSDYFNTLRFKGSEENTAFVEYQKHWMTLQNKAVETGKRIQANKQNKDSLNILTGLQKLQEAKMRSYLKDVIKANNGNLLSVLVKAMLPVDNPEINFPAGTSNPDSVRWIRTYIYNKNHFFDNIDLSDERLVYTPILMARLNAFFNNVVIPSADSINKEIDILIKKCSSNYKTFQFVSVYLFNHFRESEIMGHDAVLVKIADDIYLSGKADWVTEEFKNDLRKQVDRLRPNLIGQKAKDLVMDSYKGIFVSLYDISKEFTVLYFWEPDCSHCSEATPKLKSFYAKARNEGVEIFTVCTTADRGKWIKYIDDNKLTWINGWDPKRTSRYDYFYNVQSTPMIYVLDRNKKIIAKKLPVENLASFIDNYRKYSR